MKVYVLQYTDVNRDNKMNHIQVFTDYQEALKVAVDIGRNHFEDNGSYSKANDRSMINLLDNLDYTPNYANQFNAICEWTDSLETTDCDDYLEMSIGVYTI